MARVPIACTLAATVTEDRIQEWRTLLTSHVVQVERSGTVVGLRLGDGNETLLSAVDLARREKACCAFFDFRLVLLSEAVWLEIEAPDDAVAVLDRLVSLL